MNKLDVTDGKKCEFCLNFAMVLKFEWQLFLVVFNPEERGKLKREKKEKKRHLYEWQAALGKLVIGGGSY